MIYSEIHKASLKGEKLFTVLIDPDKYDENALIDLISIAEKSNVHYFFIGGSLMTTSKFEKCVDIVKTASKIPVILFPGSNVQVSKRADAILFLSLISGRNPEFLIGQHVVAAPYIKNANLEVLPTGYMLIEGSNVTTANYMSNTLPIPRNKHDIAACTAMTGEMLGLKLIYLDGGSGAGKTISSEMIKSVKSAINLPLIIGGGITTVQQAEEIWKNGADMIVVGNAIENDLSLIKSISDSLQKVH